MQLAGIEIKTVDGFEGREKEVGDRLCFLCDGVER
jgi:hypothetical protein